MKYFIYTIAIIILFGLNVGLFPHFKISGAGPNLLLLLLVLVALQKQPELYFVAFLSGMFLDFSSGVFFGSFTFSFLLLALVFNVLLERILVLELNWKHFVSSTAAAQVFTATVLWMYNLLAYKLGWIQFGLDAKVLTARFVPELCYNLLLLYPMYEAVYRLQNLVASQDRKKVHHV